MIWFSQRTIGIFVIVINVATANATALAVLWTPSETVIAADTLEGRACKVQEVNNVVFAAAGIVYDRNGYDLESIVQNIMTQQGSVREKIAIFDHLIKPPLKNAFKSDILKDYIKLTVPIFAAVDNGELKVYIREFRLSMDDEIIQTSIECPGKECGQQFPYLVGPEDLKKKTLEKRRDWGKQNLTDVARSFVQEQIDRRIPGVGPPIDLVRLTARGIEWVQRNSRC